MTIELQRGSINGTDLRLEYTVNTGYRQVNI